MRRASEFSMILEKLSLSTRTSAALVVTFALRIFRATSPNGVSPSDWAQVLAASSNTTNWVRQMFTAVSLYFAAETAPVTGTQVQVTHQSNQGEVRVARALLSAKKKEVRVESRREFMDANVR